jgi:hypothetical protein
MDCDALADRKLVLAEGEAGGDPALEEHLQACEPCRTDVEEMRDVRRLYREAAVETMPDRVRARALALHPAGRRSSRWARFTPPAVAALLLAALVVPFLRAPEAPPPANPAVEAWNVPGIDEVRERLPEIESRRPAPAAGPSIDHQLRELRRQAPTLTLDEW